MKFESEVENEATDSSSNLRAWQDFAKGGHKAHDETLMRQMRNRYLEDQMQQVPEDFRNAIPSAGDGYVSGTSRSSPSKGRQNSQDQALERVTAVSGCRLPSHGTTNIV